MVRHALVSEFLLLLGLTTVGAGVAAAQGSVVAWGSNEYSESSTPVLCVAVAGGVRHSVGLTADGRIVTWGCSAGTVPAPNTGFVAVAAGWRHSLGLTGVLPPVSATTGPRDEKGLLLVSVGPNPTHGGVVVRFSVPEREVVGVRVYDAAGRLVRVLTDGPRAAGDHTLTWSGHDTQEGPVASGVYFVRLTDGRSAEGRKVVLLR
jgi:FlgD Ig-like domain/Regulator of chromosome condensation (RCC1) repeat